MQITSQLQSCHNPSQCNGHPLQSIAMRNETIQIYITQIEMELLSACLSYAWSTPLFGHTFSHRSHTHVLSQGDLLPELGILVHEPQTLISVQMWPCSGDRDQTCPDAPSGAASRGLFDHNL